MKLFSAAALAATAVAADTEPPVISLDMDALSDYANIMKLKNSVVRSHDLGYKNNGVQVGSRQDWVERCPAKSSTKESCPFPSASAFDHSDGKVSVTKRIFLVDADGASSTKQVADVNFGARATYLFKFDASDAAGNHAEQIVFGLILDDVEAPAVKVCGAASETVEAASSYTMCSDSSATDNIDGTVAVSYSTKSPSGVVASGNTINTKQTGAWTVTVSASDKAGVYGHDGASNKAEAQKVITVTDTTGPKITLTGADVVQQECKSAFTDKWGATAMDALDGATATASTNNVNTDKLATYNIVYTSVDKVGNKATPVIRKVDVKDTTAPTVTLFHKDGTKAADTIEISAGEKIPNIASKCADTCSEYTKITSAVSPAFNTLKPGTYTKTWTCKDVSGNAGTHAINFVVVDKTQPVVNINGPSIVQKEASPTADYVDAGAVCADAVDGQINDAVRVSGDNVKMGVPGTYKITYNCKDAAGNAGPAITRTVVVADTSCPVITVVGKQLMELEAGFPYKDAGATAHDSLDGDLTSSIVKSGDTVTVSQAFYAKTSCAEIKAAYPGTAPTGTYFITSKVDGAYKRVKVTCDMATGSTFKTCEDCTRVTPYGAVEGDCSKYGMKMLQAKDMAAAKKLFLPAYFPARGASNMYVCEGSSNTDNVHATSEKVDHRQISQAESGKYIIKYSVQDKAGNKHCKAGLRTVVVRDTLPPVITVTIGNKIVHTSAFTANNPAGNPDVNPFLAKALMEEQTSSVNGWIIGAVASAVTGVALLGLSHRRTETSVPV